MMNKLFLFTGVTMLLFLVGCGTVGSVFLGYAISISSNLICNEVQDVPILGDFCKDIIDVILGIPQGTIEIRNENGQWITLTSDAMQFKLLENSGKQQVMVYKKIPAGKYNQIRIDVEFVKIITMNKTYTTVIPNKYITIDTNIIVDENGKSITELNIDLAKSLHMTTKDDIIFAPVIDVNSKRNINVNILDANKKLINVNGGVLLDKKRVGMDIKGQMRQDFVLNTDQKLAIKNNQIVQIDSNPRNIETKTTKESEVSTNYEKNAVQQEITQPKEQQTVIPEIKTQDNLNINNKEPVLKINTYQTDVLGIAGAPITIIEWGDFQCPFCGRFYRDTMPQIKQQYINTGKVRFTFKHYPLNFHSNAQKAAEATECAKEHGRFWEMHNKLFDNQKALTISDLKKYATELGLNEDQFDECLDTNKYAQKIADDMIEGEKIGVSGTPAFSINGKLVSGALPFSSFKEAIDDQLQDEAE